MLFSLENKLDLPVMSNDSAWRPSVRSVLFSVSCFSVLVLLHNDPDPLVKTNDPAWRPSVRFGLGLSVLFSLSCFSANGVGALSL